MPAKRLKDGDDVKPDISTSEDGDTPKPSKRHKPTASPGDWTAEKREKLINIVFDAGLKVAGKQDVADQLGLNLAQIKNALNRGRKGNFRDKAVKAVQSDK